MVFASTRTIDPARSLKLTCAKNIDKAYATFAFSRTKNCGYFLTSNGIDITYRFAIIVPYEISHHSSKK